VRRSVHGVVVEASWPLPNGRPADAGAPVRLRLDRVPPGTVSVDPSATVVAAQPQPPHRHELFAVPDGTHVLRVPGVLDAALDPDGRVRIAPQEDADEDVVGLTVAGLVLSVALLLAGETLLHASAVEVGGRALGVIGPSGAGKSTTAGLLCAAGALLVSDDQLRVSGHPPDCWRSASGLRARDGGLGPAVAEALGGGSRTADGRNLLAPEVTGRESCRLVALVVPRPDPSADAVELVRLRGVQAAAALMSARPLPGAYGPAWESAEFDRFMALAADVPVHEARIPWRRAALPAAGRALLQLLDG
jgi:hypothetical protein